ncbi:TetR/AcrR family transcriptional regulator [Jatrophihabitans sp. YIM 134969]
MSTAAAVTGTKGVPRAERTDQILDIAVAEFATHGYAGASVATIARQAGISKPLIYQYFLSKDGLYLACLHRTAGGLLARLEPAWSEEDDSVQARVRTLGALFDALAPRREAWKLLWDPTMPGTGAIAATAQGYRDRTAQVATSGSSRFLRARGVRGTKDASALSAVWLGLVDSLVTWWIEHPEESAAAMTRRCARLMAAVLSDPG